MQLEYKPDWAETQERCRAFYGGEAFPVWTGGYPRHTAIPAGLGCRWRSRPRHPQTG